MIGVYAWNEQQRARATESTNYVLGIQAAAAQLEQFLSHEYPELDVEGAVAIGANYSGSNTAPGNGAIIEGDVGIGT